MAQIKKFTNTRYAILEFLYSHKDGNNVARVTQGEISNGIGVNRVTINKLISELRQDGFIQDAAHYWEYTLTPKAISFISAMKIADKKISENT